MPDQMRLLNSLLFLMLLNLPQSGRGAEPRFFRDDGGVPADLAAPVPDRFDRSGDLQWRQPLDSGHSTPCVYGNRIYLTTYNAERRELATLALDRGTGETVWRRVVPTDRIEPFHNVGSPAAPSAACDGQRVYAFFGSQGLTCYDLDGNQIWNVPMGPFQDEFGTGSSPVLADGKVIVAQDHDANSFVIALEATTGKELWKTERPNAVRSYSTPMIWDRGDQKQIILAGALDLSAYDLETGKRQWWVTGLARIVIPVPTREGDTLFVSTWAPGGDSGSRISMGAWDDAANRWDRNRDEKISKSELEPGEVLTRFFRMDLNQDNGLDRKEWERHAAVFENARNAVLAIRPGSGTGDLTRSAVVWEYSRGVPYVSSPLVHGNILYMVKDGGIVTKLEASTGKLLHQERLSGLGNYYASPVTAGGNVYFASEQGVVTVVRDQVEWEIISSHDFGERIYATPTIDRDRIFLRTEKALYSFAHPGKS
jgi:outer membrane protein assembly factor BamB